MTIKFNGIARYSATKTWGSCASFEHELPARITQNRVAVGLKSFSRTTGECKSKRFPLSDYYYKLMWYQINGKDRVTL